MVVAPSVGEDVRRDVLPRDHHEEVEINPPDQQQRKIQIADVHVQVVALVVRLQGEGADHRYGMQEQNHIADEGIGNALPQIHFKICPDALANEPREAAEAKQDPEDAGAFFGSAPVEDQAAAGKHCRDTLHDVAERGQAAAIRNCKSRNGIAADQQHPPGGKRPPGRRHLPQTSLHRLVQRYCGAHGFGGLVRPGLRIRRTGGQGGPVSARRAVASNSDQLPALHFRWVRAMRRTQGRFWLGRPDLWQRVRARPPDSLNRNRPPHSDP